MNVKSVLMVGLVAIAASALVSSVAQNSMSGRVAASAAPKFELSDVRSSTPKPVSLQSALSGRKAVLLNFWFAACPPCREEMPHLQETYKQYKARGLEIVGVNATDGDAEIQAFGREFGLGFPLARDAERQVSNAYNVSATPTNVLIDSQGNVIWRSEGFDEAGLKQILDETLPAPAST